MIIAQTLGEYGALAGIAATFQKLWYQAEVALRQPSVSLPLIGVALVAGYFLLRRR